MIDMVVSQGDVIPFTRIQLLNLQIAVRYVRKWTEPFHNAFDWAVNEKDVESSGRIRFQKWPRSSRQLAGHRKNRELTVAKCQRVLKDRERR